jgi:hypothetical protein
MGAQHSGAETVFEQDLDMPEICQAFDKLAINLAWYANQNTEYTSVAYSRWVTKNPVEAEVMSKLQITYDNLYEGLVKFAEEANPRDVPGNFLRLATCKRDNSQWRSYRLDERLEAIRRLVEGSKLQQGSRTAPTMLDNHMSNDNESESKTIAASKTPRWQVDSKHITQKFKTNNLSSFRAREIQLEK